MSKTITFSRTFPTYHPKEGQPTYFVEAILNQINADRHDFSWRNNNYIQVLYKLNEEKIKTGKLTHAQILYFYKTLDKSIAHSKLHTIRSGHRWKVCDKFSPRVWSGKPYASKQVIIAPDMEVKKVWNFEIEDRIMYVDKMPLTIVEYRELVARNDGLSYQDFKDWFRFPKPFSGQIICWNESLNY